MTCDYCHSQRGVEDYGGTLKCQVCARLLGTDYGENPSLHSVNRNIVTLFHTLGMTPHDTDEEDTQ